MSTKPIDNASAALQAQLGVRKAPDDKARAASTSDSVQAQHGNRANSGSVRISAAGLAALQKSKQSPEQSEEASRRNDAATGTPSRQAAAFKASLK